MDADLERLDALAIVKPPSQLNPTFGKGIGSAIVSIWCRAAHGTSSKKHPFVGLNSRRVDDPLAVSAFVVAARNSIAKIGRDHSGCFASAKAAKEGGAHGLNISEAVAETVVHGSPALFPGMKQLEREEPQGRLKKAIIESVILDRSLRSHSKALVREMFPSYSCMSSYNAICTVHVVTCHS